MKIKIFLLVMSLILSLTISTTSASQNICGVYVDSAIKNLHSWQDLHSWYQKYHECDDGYFAEGVSDFVVRALAKNWHTLPMLQREVIRDSQFTDFVLKHIDSTGDNADLRIITKKAKTHCPAKHQRLCHEIKKRAEIALQEMTKTKSR
ncbi:MAG: hypothetical protein JW943_12500 [Deltaproteobacteria bacterium]|nr:hypothetical protein [Deltaproteobacteria bacterium]